MSQRSLTPDHNTVGSLYDAVLQRDAAPLLTAVHRIEQQLASDGCHWFALSRASSDAFTVCTYQDMLVDVGTTEFYQSYAHADPRQHFAKTHIGQAFKCSSYFDERFVGRNAFYQDYLLPRDRRFTLGGCLSASAGAAFIAFNRFKGSPDFSDEEVQLVAHYFPHLARVSQLLQDEAAHSMLHGTQSDLLQQQDVGVLGLDQHQRVLFINPAARQHLTLLPQLGWQGASVRADSPLALACQQAHASRQPQAMRQRVAAGEVVVTAWATPRRAYERWLPSVASASDTPLHTCVLVQLLRPGQRITPSLLMKLYGLTAAEARLAKELVQGTAVEDYALKFSVSVATVRTQLRQVLAKTGFARQQDLVRHLAAIQVL